MKSLLKSLTVLLAIGMLNTCSGPTKPEHQSFLYPLAQGNQWTYQFTRIRIYDGDTPTDTVQYVFNTAVVRVDTVLPGIYLYEIKESFTDDLGYDFEGIRAYINLPDGMYIYCDGGTGWNPVLLKGPNDTAGGDPRDFHSEHMRMISESILFPQCTPGEYHIDYYDPGRLALPYPQKVGHRWTYVEESESGPFGLDKEIVGWEQVTTPAGTFNCVSIAWIHTGDSLEVDIATFVAAQGLALRTMTVYDIPVTSYSYPYGTGETYDAYETWELIEFHLN